MTNGLQMVIDKCSSAWVESGPPYSYTCGGTQTALITSRAVIQAGLALPGPRLAERRRRRA